MDRILTIAVFLLILGTAGAQTPEIAIQWNDSTAVSRATPTLQVVGNPMLRRGAPMHDNSFLAVHDLQADYVRYVPWFPYPKLAVAELKPPTATETFWDFSLIDPMTIDFMEATKGHSVILNFSTTPQWMWKTEKPVDYPEDANKVCWSYAGGTELRDTTMKELTDYYTRLVSWYTKGGFTDELGKFHRSGYTYTIPYWEVLNEPDLEHNISVQTYTKIYDAVVTAIRTVSPQTKFVGLALAFETRPEYFEYFLNPANHKPGIPLDMISYHCYAHANDKQPFEAYDHAVFDNTEPFLSMVRYIENIRKRLSPATKTDIDELGTFVNGQMRDQPITPAYWNLSASVYAYFFIELTKAGIDVIGESQLVGFPSQFPDVTMVDYQNNKPNARYWVLKLIRDNIRTGSALVNTAINGNSGDDLSAQAFSHGGSKKILILNKRNKPITVRLPSSCNGARSLAVNTASGDGPPLESTVDSTSITLQPFEVRLIVLAQPTAAQSPPMGWNSYNCFGSAVHEDEVRANTDYLAQHLKPFGWQYIVVDFLWSYDNPPGSLVGNPFQSRLPDGAYIPWLAMDQFGRLTPNTNKFPSAEKGKGFKPLADYVHAQGLKFGIHVMRGIPRQAVWAHSPIQDAGGITADQVADTSSTCPWMNHMYGLDMQKPGAQEYLNSLLRLYASWGVDFIKVDDISRPYHQPEIEGYRKAIASCGRPIVLSLSPGETPLRDSTHVRQYANMWRMADDFWDSWQELLKMFDYAKSWEGLGGPGHWPDCDMLQIGKISKRGPVGPERYSRFTPDELRTHLTFWCIYRSPLMLGGNLPDNRPLEDSLFTNPEPLAVNQDGTDPRQLFKTDSRMAWFSIAPAPPGHRAWYVALFNLADTPQSIPLDLTELSKGKVAVRDLWKRSDAGVFSGRYAQQLPAHGSALLKLTK